MEMNITDTTSPMKQAFRMGHQITKISQLRSDKSTKKESWRNARKLVAL